MVWVEIQRAAPVSTQTWRVPKLVGKRVLRAGRPPEVPTSTELLRLVQRLTVGIRIGTGAGQTTQLIFVINLKTFIHDFIDCGVLFLSINASGLCSSCSSIGHLPFNGGRNRSTEVPEFRADFCPDTIRSCISVPEMILS